MARLALLENFDPPPPEDPALTPEWLAGHAAGIAEGRAAALAEQGMLRADAAQALADLAFGFREAETILLARLGSLFRAIADQAVPAILRDTLGIALIEELESAAADDLAAGVVLRVAPDDAAAVSDLLQTVAGHGFVLRPDPRLPAGQVLIEAASGGTAFDFARLRDDIATAIAALSDEPARSSEHG